jgi:hypothetical protein
MVYSIPISNLILTLVFTALIVANKSARGLGGLAIIFVYTSLTGLRWIGMVGVLSADWSIGLLGGGVLTHFD